jgi:SAM-dependent methyltransferase
MNPYKADDLYGVDIRTIAELQENFRYSRVDLTTEALPFPDEYFDSLSAFDLLEHIPRSIVLQNTGTRFPFVDLMSEISRVLKPGGLFYAITPCYPDIAAFSDPTHVNIITKKTHLYFCGEKPLGRIYGFKGSFRCRSARLTYGAIGNSANEKSFQIFLKHLRKRFKGQLSHIFWELEKM